MILQEWGYDVRLAVDGNQAKELVESYDPEIVISDVVMPQLSGLDLLRCLKAGNPSRPVILVTAHASIDLAVESGGNVEGSRAGEIVTTANGVKIVGHVNMAARVPVDASQLYARNLLAFLALIVDKEGKLRIDTADEIVKAALLTMDGAIVNPALMPEPALAAAATS